MNHSQNNLSKIYDIAIVGGGMAGTIAAYGLAKIGLSVALIESIEPIAPQSVSFDSRSVALSASSVQILSGLGLWNNIAHLACPIDDIHVSEVGQFGFVRMNAKNAGVKAMGQVIPLDLAGPLLWQQLANLPSLTTYCPYQVENLAIENDLNSAKLSIKSNDGNQQEISASLVLAADGTFSNIAKNQGLTTKRVPYNQVAIIANIKTDKPHNNKAFERFTSSGPLALLPLPQNQMSLVWCHKPEQAEQLMAKTEHEFIAQLQQAFGFRLGKITQVSERVCYPLSSHWAEKHFSQHLLLMGNASHTLHPIAGQGFNLGLRDIAILLEQVSDAINNKQPIFEQRFLSNFVTSRQSDWSQTHLATDSLARLFSNEFYPLTITRNKGLASLNRLPLIKNKFAQMAMGYSNNNAKLARGYCINDLVVNEPLQKINGAAS